MSTFSPNLRFELITTGTQAGAWGNTTNTNIGTLIEASVSGYNSVSVTTAAQAFTALYGAADQSRNAMIRLTTATAAAFAVYAPPVAKQYTVFNDTSYIATIYNSTVIGNTTAAGTGVALPAGATMAVWSDATNFRQQNTHFISPTMSSPVMTGTPLAPTAATVTNTTQVATTAFVQAVLAAAVLVLYPVGSIYTNATNNTNPGTLLGFGTWVAFGAGRVPVGFDGTNPLFDAAEETGGSADSVTVSHTHTATTVLSSTTHTHSGTTAGGGSHDHYMAVNTLNGSDPSTNPNQPIARQKTSGGDSDYDMRAVIGGTANCGLTNTVGTHTHTITTGNNSVTPTAATTVTAAGVAGTNLNYQPYITVYMWKRTA
jgi:hypothetical protein